MGAVAGGAVLLSVLLIVVAALVWQEARRPHGVDPPVYLLDEATRFVYDRLDEDTARFIDLDDVRRILEWGIHYNQVVAVREQDRLPVVGSGEGMEYIMERAAAGGRHLEPIHIAEVMAAETEYLVEIGAIGTAVEGEPV